ncbi:hypothetical protein GCM10027038_17770 [Arthrobacter bambusae]
MKSHPVLARRAFILSLRERILRSGGGGGFTLSGVEVCGNDVTVDP